MSSTVSTGLSLVKGKFFFHIDRKSNSSLKVGETYFIGAKRNPFIARFDVVSMSRLLMGTHEFDVVLLLKEIRELIEHGTDSSLVSDFFQGSVPWALAMAKDALTEYLNWIRETVFEEIRKEHFPHLPLRQRCLWLVPHDSKAARYWFQRLEQKGRLLEVRATGKLFRANEAYLRAATTKLNAVRGDAFRYWAGGSGIDEHADELLFEGFVDVEREVDLETLDPS